MKNKTTKQTRVAAEIILAILVSFIGANLAYADIMASWPNTTSPLEIQIDNDPSGNNNTQTTAQSTQTGDGNFIVTWADYRSGTADIYGAKVDSSGNYLWTGDNISLASSVTNNYIDPVIISDEEAGGTGAFIAFVDSTDDEIYIMRVDGSDGSLEWGPTVLSTGSLAQDLTMVPDGNGGAYVAWFHMSDYIDIKITRVNSSGTIVAGWSPAVTVDKNHSSESDYIWPMYIIPTDAGGVYAVYLLDYNNGIGHDYYISTVKYTASGSLESGNWASGAIEYEDTDAEELYSEMGVTTDGNDGLIFAYNAHNSFTSPWFRIKTQRIDSSGNFQWGTNGILLYGSDSNPGDYPEIISDNENGAIITFDARTGSYWDMYAIRVDSSGDKYSNWTASPGVALSNTGDTISARSPFVWPFHTVKSDNNGGAFVVMDIGNYYYLQHIDSSGTLGLGTNGYQLGTVSAGTDMLPDLSGDGINSTLMVWAGGNASGYRDIYGQLFSSYPCETLGSDQICVHQSISFNTLTFTSIPESIFFTLPTITGVDENLFNNGATNQPDTEDMLTILDDRGTGCSGASCTGGGGFEVQVDISGDFTSGTETIPADNLYIVTSIDEDDPGESNGLIYDYAGGFEGDDNATIPLYIYTGSGCANCDLLETAGTYTDEAPDSQFGSGPLVLIDGSLPIDEGRKGTMWFYTNFYLLVPAFQPQGDYSATITYSLLDNTTE